MPLKYKVEMGAESTTKWKPPRGRHHRHQEGAERQTDEADGDSARHYRENATPIRSPDTTALTNGFRAVVVMRAGRRALRVNESTSETA